MCGKNMPQLALWVTTISTIFFIHAFIELCKFLWIIAIENCIAFSDWPRRIFIKLHRWANERCQWMFDWWWRWVVCKHSLYCVNSVYCTSRYYSPKSLNFIVQSLFCNTLVTIWLLIFQNLIHLHSTSSTQRRVLLHAAHSLVTFCRYLVDPASSICLSQRLSHACPSINNFIQRNCVQLITSVIISLKVAHYMGYLW